MAERSTSHLMGSDIEITKAAISELKPSLPKSIGEASDGMLPKVAWKFLVFREAAIWRFWELSDSALKLIELKNYTSSSVMIRSAFEMNAILHYMCAKINVAISNDDPRELNQLAMQILMGSKVEDGSDRAVNIMTALECLEKDVPKTTAFYANLSELAHPNWEGVAVPFSFGPMDQYNVNFGRDLETSERLRARAIRDLDTVLMHFEIPYNDFSKVLPALDEFCTRHFERSA